MRSPSARNKKKYTRKNASSVPVYRGGFNGIYLDKVVNGEVIDRYKIIAPAAKDHWGLYVKFVEKDGNIYIAKEIQNVFKNIKSHNFLKIANNEVECTRIASELNVGPKLIDSWVNDDNVYIVMEKLEITLKDYLKAQGSDPSERTDILYAQKIPEKICSIIHKLLKKGLIQGDETISNWMFDATGEIKIIDFGSAVKVNPKEVTIETIKDIFLLRMKGSWAYPREEFANRGVTTNDLLFQMYKLYLSTYCPGVDSKNATSICIHTGGKKTA